MRVGIPAARERAVKNLSLHVPAGELHEDVLEIVLVGVGASLELVHRPALHQLAVHDDADSIAELLRNFERMGGDEDGIAICTVLPEHTLDEVRAFRVESDHRFVHDPKLALARIAPLVPDALP